MTAGELLTGQLFKLPGKRRRFLKLRDSSVLLAVQNGPHGENGAHYVQHDAKGDPIFTPTILARTMSGRKFDLPKTREVIPL